MKKFLELAANDLYRRFGNNLADITVVFPNKRAKNFFNNYLYNSAEKTLWSPNYLTISELIENSATLNVADTLQLVCELYEVYANNTKTNENFNDFYFWGEMLLHDFDDIDKQMVDAKQLFQNLQNLKKIQNTFDFLDENQQKALEQFFTNFSLEKQSELKQKFIEIWDVLGNIYQQFREKLQEQNLAYEGMLYRSVIENNNINIIEKLNCEKYAFVGFNVLNVCEKELFYLLKKHEKALFYWDYDEYYLRNKNNEAGFFMQDNLREFPSELSPENFKSLSENEKKIRLISSPTENAQARYLHEWTKGLQNIDDSAVVLCNESLLLPLLYSLPENVSDVNITMGFPLSQTPIYNTINVLIDLQTKGFDKNKKLWNKNYVLEVLQNQYIQTLSPEIKNIKNELQKSNNYKFAIENFYSGDDVKFIFKPVENTNDFVNYLIEILKKISQKNTTNNQLYNEAIFRTYTALNRFGDLLNNKKLVIEIKILSLLLRRLLSATNVPFAGEPTKGLQIMGILETRNLDFKNILLLSANENLLPKSENEASFIPYNLRRAFGLTTSDKRNSIYAYYFYRLLQRADNITISYCAATKGLNKGEMSRFLLQLLVESNFNIELFDIQSQIKLPEISEIKVEKTPEIIRFLKNKYENTDSYLSPRALNMFIDCSLKFYFNYIAKLKLTKDDANTDSLIFGKVFHKTSEIIYKKINKFENSYINENDLDTFINNKELLKNIVDDAMKTEAKIDNEKNYSIQQLIMRDVIVDYIKKLLEFDKTNIPFTLFKIEYTLTEKFNFNTPAGNVDVHLGGLVDRCDIKENVMRVVDYKTGGSSKTIKSIEDLFVSSKNRNSYAFQVFLYSLIIAKQQPEFNVMPSILYINKKLTETEDIQIKFDKEKISDIRQIETDFFNQLSKIISDIFDEKNPFIQTENKDICEYCDFKQICKR
ncbi:MAG: PD-(D/E)XK nuclease family protein [Prevotellaceae bacterium]|jgi:CRISPR/Cas system-associated exonuclease Cas4 (RecB family)|nr:PD-(D/E)XK nuclease family protein [Prevotellaceae bacterium]